MLIVLKSQFHNFETIFLKTRRVLPAVHKIQFECQFFDELPPTKSSATLLYCHIKAFEFFGGILDEILYDNMKTAWYYDGEHWQTNRQLARALYVLYVYFASYFSINSMKSFSSLRMADSLKFGFCLYHEQEL